MVDTNNPDDLNPKIRQVSGPVNVVRLQGKVHDITKVVYLFMDWHENVKHQTQCDNIFSKDVQKFFIDSFHQLNRSNRTYDFFLEIHPTELAETRPDNQPTKNYKEKYIWEIAKLFQKVFVFDPHTNKVSIPDIFRNVRFHYADLRDYFKLHIFDKLADVVASAEEQIRNYNIRTDSIKLMIDLYTEVIGHLQYIIGIISNNMLSDRQKEESNKSFGSKTQHRSRSKSRIRTNRKPKSRIIKYKKREYEDKTILMYMTNKIMFRYNDKYIQKVLNELLADTNKNFINLLELIDAAIQLFRKYGDVAKVKADQLYRDERNPYLYGYGLSSYTVRHVTTDITDTAHEILDKCIDYFTGIMDVYFLRRFLDKEYITNAIVYTGAAHSTVYINMLVKHFGFKITHVSYSKITDLKKLMKEVKEKPPKETEDLFNPPRFKQCSDITHFPKDFR